MKVILLGELRGKGGEGDLIEVAQGYAENYLFPKRMAVPATPGNVKQLEERRHNIAKREEKRVSDAQALKESLDGKSVFINVKVGEEGQLFGSVTSTMIEKAIKEQLGQEIDRKRVERTNSIKSAGKHAVTLGIYRDITATVTLEVGDESTRAKEQEASKDASSESSEQEDQLESESSESTEASAESTEE